MGGDAADQTCPLALESVARGHRRRHVVRLVYHQDVEFARIGDMRWQDILDQAQGLTGFHPIHGSDKSRERGPRVCVDTLLTTQAFQVVRVHNAKLETELLVHLDLPLQLERRRADYEHCARPVTDEELLNDEAGFDGLT